MFGAFAVSQRNQADRERNQANQQRNLAQLATDDALAGGLTAKVDSLLGAGEHDLALLLAVEANNAASHLPPSSPSVRNARDALLHVVAAQPTLLHTLSGLQGKLGSVVYSPDGRTIVAQSTSGAVRVWDATTGEESAHRLPATSGGSVTGIALNDAGDARDPRFRGGEVRHHRDAGLGSEGRSTLAFPAARLPATNVARPFRRWAVGDGDRGPPRRERA